MDNRNFYNQGNDSNQKIKSNISNNDNHGTSWLVTTTEHWYLLYQMQPGQY
jgi:hypothetical protein